MKRRGRKEKKEKANIEFRHNEINFFKAVPDIDAKQWDRFCRHVRKSASKPKRLIPMVSTKTKK